MNIEVTKAVHLAIISYKRAWEYRRAIIEKWEPRAEELRKLDEFNRTHIAWENADTRSEWLIEESAHVLLRALSGRQPIEVEPFKLSVFERCRNRLWLKAFSAYKTAFEETLKQYGEINANHQTP